AQDVLADREMPFFDNSAMDGFAVRSQDLADQQTMPICGTVAAGHASGTLTPGCAMQIFTGAPIPEGADAVIKIEDTRVAGREITFCGSCPRPGQNIRRRGSDQDRGTCLLRKGQRIAAHHVGLLAAQGLRDIRVVRRPRIAVASTGHELGDAADASARIYDANRPMLLALVTAMGGEVIDMGVIPDDAAPNLYASARYMLKKLGMSEGGERIQTLRKSLRRIGGIRYENDCFYDPVRKTHRKVDFSLLSSNLPFREDSICGWTINWDQTFFDMVKPAGGFLAFDLETLRELSPAAGRLFLLLQKYFYPGKRKRLYETPYLDVERLAIHNLGCDVGQPPAEYNRRVKRLIAELTGFGIVSSATATERYQKGVFRVRFKRGSYFDRKPTATPLKIEDQAVFETLSRLELSEKCARWVIRDFKTELINKWADVTFAAEEQGRIRESKQQFFVHHIKEGKAGNITPPDWYVACEKEKMLEQEEESHKLLEQLGISLPSAQGFETFLQRDGRREYLGLVSELLQDFRLSATDDEQASKLARQSAKVQMRRRYSAWAKKRKANS
ncbi:MAG: molybdopterin molybdotransferase MoeA, partial [Cyanobacteria bacterium P01_E01_bin.48]